MNDAGMQELASVTMGRKRIPSDGTRTQLYIVVNELCLGNGPCCYQKLEPDTLVNKRRNRKETKQGGTVITRRQYAGLSAIGIAMKYTERIAVVRGASRK